MNILIISGGNSSERKISLLSAKEVRGGLNSCGHQVRIYDLKQGYPQLKRQIAKFDVIFPVIHGEEGEGGKLHRFLAKQSKPFVGGNWQGFKTGWYKIPFKRFCNRHQILTSPWRVVKQMADIRSFGFPSVLKSSSGGSSKEVVILKSGRDLGKRAVQNLLSTRTPLHIEKYLSGVEVTAAILNNRALPVIEISTPPGQWFNYRNKYSGKTREVTNAPSLNIKTRKLVQRLALKIHQALKLGHYSRIDFIVVGNIPYALEVNTIPGLTANSLFPKAAQATGLSFKELVNQLVHLPLS